MRMQKKTLMLACLVLLSGAVAACAPMDVVLVPSYTAAGKHTGAGPLVLGLAADGPGATGGVERVQFIYGEVRDTDGKIKGNVVGSVSSAQVVRDALQQELSKSGYGVRFDSALASKAERGVVVTAASLTLGEVASLVKVEAECKVQLALELWQQGKLIRKLTYSNKLSDFAVRDREKLHQQVLQKTLATVMQAAVADVAVYFK